MLTHSWQSNFSFLCNFNPIRPGGGGGAHRPWWPNSELPVKNLLPYDAQTLWLLVFIFKTCSDQILAKLVNKGGCCCSFLIETSQNFWKWKIFLCLKIAEIDMGVNFGSKFCDIISPKLEMLPDSNFASGMLSWLYGLMQSFISIGWW